MVHPATGTNAHSQYFRWINSTLKEWKKKLEENDSSEFLAEFDKAFEDLKSTVAASLPAKDKIQSKLLHALRNIKPELLNSTDESTIEKLVEWKSSYGFILVGGQSINRGFTVEGLTVTYMPRNAGVKNIDSIQQRARFFGYRLNYLGYCRVYLEAEVIAAYEAYARHEEDIRKQLVDHGDVPLNDWERAFFMDKSFQPTRSTVLSLGFRRGDFSKKWYYPRAPHESQAAIDQNNKLIADFKDGLTLVPDPIYSIHDVAANLAVKDVLEKLLAPYMVTSLNDSKDRTGLLLQIASAVDAGNTETCDVYFMKSKKEDRVRSVENGKLSSLFGGAFSIEEKGQTKRYPGDSKLKSDEKVIVEIFNFDINDLSNDEIVKNVPIVAVYLPLSMRASFMVQDDATSQTDDSA